MEKYDKVNEYNLEEVNAKMTIYRHKKTGARVACISSSDENKVFAISFKTPAINSTGVTHIIEHSVLCGSKKYPIKDPFVELLKGSMNTFLNAMTYPDKTIYPVASTNDTDFKNLMSIYLDAVFFPNMYVNKNIFLQEGWHYEIFDKDEPLKINGVVYNEMKGAYSSVDENLFDAMMNNCLAGTTYDKDSGGNPDFIPTLTYEDFINFHKQYYSPSNAYIYIYGNCDMKERLNYLDKEYLSKFDKIDINPEIKFAVPFNELKEVNIKYPIGENETLEDKTNFGLAIRLTPSSDIKGALACSILEEALLNGSSAYLRKKFVEANIAKQVSGGFMGGINEGMFLITAKEADVNNKNKFLSVFNESIKELIEGKLDHEVILSILNNLEFKARENLFGGIPFGLEIILKSMDTWLYNEENPCGKLTVLPLIKELKEELEEGYFEKLLDVYFLKNTSKVLVIQEPSKTLMKEKEEALEAKLENYKKSLSSEEIDDLIKMNNDLKEWQSKVDSKEDINKIPHLSIDDLKTKYPIYKFDKEEENYKIYSYKANTNKIIYGKVMFDIKDLPLKYVPYLSLFNKIFLKLETKKKTKDMIDKYINNKFGIFAIGAMKEDLAFKDDYKFFETFSFSCLSENSNEISDFILELIDSIKLDDVETIKEIVDREKVVIMSKVEAGHSLARIRAASYQSKSALIYDLLSGVSYIDFIKDLSSNFEEKKEVLIGIFKLLLKNIFVKERMSCYTTCDSDDFDLFKEEVASIYKNLASNVRLEGFVEDEEFNKKVIKEALSAQINVNYNIVVNNSISDFNEGHSIVLTKALSLDYMWQNLRVKGGAYGAGITINPSKGLTLYSYRDPHIKESYINYDGISDYIKNMDYSDEELLKFKIGAISDTTEVMHVFAEGERLLHLELCELPQEYLKNRKEDIINATLDDLKAIGVDFDKLYKEACRVTVGKESDINANKELFDVIRDLY